MKIGMLTQWFDPETGPAALPGVYAREFVRQGHQVRVLTGFPNYPEGSLHPGYSLAPRKREQLGELEVTRVPLYPSHNRSAIGRMANYVSFALSAASLGAGSLHGVDALWVYNSPVSIALPQLAHSRLGRIPVFLHVQDLWPDSLIESGMFPGGRIAKIASSLIDRIVRLMENRSAIIGVISPGVKDLILSRNPSIDHRRIVYAPNPANEPLFLAVPMIRKQLDSTVRAGKPVEFMYAGAMGEVQGLDTVLEAARILQSRGDIQITFVGDGISREALEAKARRLTLSNVRFTGRVPQNTIPSLMARSDVQLVSLGKSAFLKYTTPSKIPAILASGTPLIGLIDGDGAELINTSRGGFTVRPGDTAGLVQAMTRMADLGRQGREAMGAGAQRFYLETLSASVAAERITRELEARL